MEFHISKIKMIIIYFCASGFYLSSGLYFSIMPPFYPKEAEDKGAKPSEYGFVFGITFLVSFITAPIFTKFGTFIGLNNLIDFGSFIMGGSFLIFGLLDHITNVYVFLGLSYFLRALYGACIAAIWQAMLGILIKLSPDRAATIIAITETVFGLGYTIGPAVGSWLYMVGGFELPFFLAGVVSIVLQIGLTASLPRTKDLENLNNSREQESLLRSQDNSNNKSSLFRFGTILPLVDNIVCQCGISFTESMLQPHLQKNVSATQIEVGYTFLVLGLVYMICTPIIGQICDRISNVTWMSIVGNILMSLSFLLIGPSPLLNFMPTISLMYGCTAIIGFCYSCNLVTTFLRVHKTVLRIGYKDDLSTYFLVSGIWTASFYFGSFVGSTFGGVLVDQIGFDWTTTLLSALNLVMGVIDIGEYLNCVKGHSHNSLANDTVKSNY